MLLWVERRRDGSGVGRGRGLPGDLVLSYGAVEDVKRAVEAGGDGVEVDGGVRVDGSFAGPRTGGVAVAEDGEGVELGGEGRADAGGLESVGDEGRRRRVGSLLDAGAPDGVVRDAEERRDGSADDDVGEGLGSKRVRNSQL